MRATRCEYRFVFYGEDNVEHFEPPNCTAEATHISCQPFVGTKTCEKHKCRCAKPIRRETVST